MQHFSCDVGGVGSGQEADDARDLFHEAAVRTLAMLEHDPANADAIAHLLGHLDGDQGKAAGLIAVA